jgi:hypothetical protein
MFIANRLVPQHKDFLDEHGYEFREYPENEFQRRVSDCVARVHPSQLDHIETVTTPGVLAPATYELLYEIEQQQMTMCYKMLLLIAMAELADGDGRVPLLWLGVRFQEFFVDRSVQKKTEENPKRVKPGTLSRRSAQAWERVIREQPVHYFGDSFVLDEGTSIRWAARIWQQWNPDLKREIQTACFDRLIRYFNRHVPGGF